MQAQKAYAMAVELMQEHGLYDWKFHFDSARRRFGCCHLTKKAITLSFKFVELNSEDAVKDTILHEIAHALSPEFGHGPAWRRKCLEIGAKPERCYGHEILTPGLKWKGTCPKCQTVIHKARKPRSKCWHRNCGDINHLIAWERHA